MGMYTCERLSRISRPLLTCVCVFNLVITCVYILYLSLFYIYIYMYICMYRIPFRVHSDFILGPSQPKAIPSLQVNSQDGNLKLIPSQQYYIL